MNNEKSIKKSITDAYGKIDIYLFDQLMKGRFDNRHRIMDAGCGKGRNMVFFLQNGFDVYGIDNDATAIETIRLKAADRAPLIPGNHFRLGELEHLSFPDEFFDAVICNAVLHFARDEPHFRAMTDQLWRVLKPGGLLFARLASTIGITHLLQHLDGRRYRLPDDAERFLVDDKFLMEENQRLGAESLEPLKTTVVQNLRSMTTWCITRPAG